jgi:tetraacyldisaccharide 4'-kinase
LLHQLYSQIARARRRYYRQRPHLRRRLGAPVISVGNLTVGGSGKTPLVAEIARILLAMGERPAILSRGYARRIQSDGVVVVSDGNRVLSDVDHSGDEPFMMARQVPQAAVLVCASRYLAGRFAESRLGATVHVLDDGFQHFDLMRDVDLLIAPDAGEDIRTLPTGRFREPLDAAKDADAMMLEIAAPAQDSDEALSQHAERLGVATTFQFTRRIAGPTPDSPAFAFAGIAKPDRFYRDLEAAGWQLAGRRSFRDHHYYSQGDIDAMTADAKQAGATTILTTEKDAVRLPREDPRITAVPLETTIEPRFSEWLAGRVHRARSA